MVEHKNTHQITPECLCRNDYVVGRVDGRTLIGVSFGLGGWKPARLARAEDMSYFGANYSRLRMKSMRGANV